MKHIIKILLAISLAFCITSCITRRACDRKFPPLSTSDNRSSSITYVRDTTIQIHIIGDTLQRTFPSMHDTVSVLNVGLSKSVARVENGFIHHSIQQIDTTLDVILKGALRTNSIKEQVNTTTIKEPTNKSSFVDLVVWPVIQLAFALFILLLALKAFRK